MTTQDGDNPAHHLKRDNAPDLDGSFNLSAKLAIPQQEENNEHFKDADPNDHGIEENQ